MKRKFPFVLIGTVLVMCGAFAIKSIQIAAKSRPEAIVSAPISAENFAERAAEIAEISPDELTQINSVQDDLVSESACRDADNNLYRYDGNGKLKSLTLAAAPDPSLPSLTEEELFARAEQYMQQLADDPAYYELCVSELRDDGSFTACWNAKCCGYSTTDQILIRLWKNGELAYYGVNHNGAFRNITLTDAQVANAIEQAKAAAPDEVISAVSPEKVVLTLNDAGEPVLRVQLLMRAGGCEYADWVHIPLRDT